MSVLMKGKSKTYWFKLSLEGNLRKEISMAISAGKHVNNEFLLCQPQYFSCLHNPLWKSDAEQFFQGLRLCPFRRPRMGILSWAASTQPLLPGKLYLAITLCINKGAGNEAQRRQGRPDKKKRASGVMCTVELNELSCSSFSCREILSDKVSALSQSLLQMSLVPT